MKKWTIVSLLSVALMVAPPVAYLAIPASQQVKQSPDIASGEMESFIDSIINEEMQKEHLPGVAFVLVKGGKVILAKGYGYADVEQKKPVAPDRTVFRIGSITKLFTAMAVAQLADRKRIALDDDVNKYLDGLKVDGRYSEPVRVWNLLTHTAGFDQIGVGRQVSKSEDRKPLGQFLSGQLIRVRPPGQVSCYDTYAITLAGHLVERISGLSYAEYMKKNIFAPLGMTRSSVEAPDSLKPDLAIGYGYDESKYLPQRYEYYVTLPASSIDATAIDMAQFMIAVLGDGSNRSGRFLSKAAARRIKQPQFTNHKGFPGFAYGFWEDLRNGQRAILHGGNMLGYSSEMYLLPDHNTGFFIAYNRDEEAGGGTARLRDTLTEKLMDRWFPVKSAPSPKTPLQIDTSRFAGNYANNLYCHTCPDGVGWGWGVFPIRSEGQGILAMRGRRWIAVEPLVFEQENGRRRIAFRENSSGQITQMISGNQVQEKLGEWLLDEVFTPVWRNRPAEPLVARLYRDTGKWKEAAAAYESITGRRPDDGRAHYYLGFCRLQGGELDGALAAFERARELKRWLPQTAYYTASAYALKGDKERAFEWLGQAIKLGFTDKETIRTDEKLSSLREDPRFKNLIGQ